MPPPFERMCGAPATAGMDTQFALQGGSVWRLCWLYELCRPVTVLRHHQGAVVNCKLLCSCSITKDTVVNCKLLCFSISCRCWHKQQLFVGKINNCGKQLFFS
jgi:hypothetical protein